VVALELHPRWLEPGRRDGSKIARPPPSSSLRGLLAKLSSGSVGRGAEGASYGAALAVLLCRPWV